MELIPLDVTLSVCKIRDPGAVDWRGAFTALTRTGEELSLVCESGSAPADALAVEPGWRAFRVAGSLDFGMVGVIAGLSGVLAAAGISMFVVSTYDTDYVLLKAGDFARGLAQLQKMGYAVRAM
ncbi:MAG: ACT domain-containing protein [Clostridia bacterium]|nr:ACT domain-containing protein [Clostridia bacterium]